ncbi:MAG: NUDIX hydrolase [Candidatus Thorarchaeota archaeon]
MSTRRYPTFPVPGVGAVVLGSEGVLLVRRVKDPGKGLWSIPGGGVEVGETQKEAVIREVQEETGIECEVMELVNTADVILHDSNGQVEFHYLLNHYLARAVGGTIQKESPKAEVSWFYLDKLPEEEMPPQIIKIIQTARNLLNNYDSSQTQEI